MAFNKYIVCYPGGGITDMLLVIGLCLNYAITHNRLLLIDTTRASWFKHDIFTYIDFSHPNVYSQKPDYNQLADKTVYPEIMKTKYTSLSTEYRKGRYYIRGSDICLAIDLKKTYDTDVVVYSNFFIGRSRSDIDIVLSHMSFKPIILNTFIDRFKSLPKDYVSIHIRNTDKSSNVDTFLETHKGYLVNKPIFLASDCVNTISKFKTIYETNLHSFATIPDNKGKNIHYHHSEVDQETFIIDCLVDLLLLAAASSYYYSTTNSGYSKLAKILHDSPQLFHKVTSNSLSPSSILRHKQNSKPFSKLNIVN